VTEDIISASPEGGKVNPFPADPENPVQEAPALADTPLVRALAYAVFQGWPVVPLHHAKGTACSCPDGEKCTRQGKHPLTRLVPHGSKNGTTDRAKIHAWWRESPHANIGICTGEAAGIFVVDLDGPEGLAAFADLERQHGALPRTPTARTGGGGLHYYFRWPAGGVPGRNLRGRGLPIEVKAEGHYVVASPSRNAKGSYTWEVKPFEPVADAPEWLLALCRDDGKAKSSPEPQLPFSPPAPASPPPPAPASPPPPPSVVPPAWPVSSPRRWRSSSLSPRERASAYARSQKVPPAISKQGGHDQTYRVARSVGLGFDLGEEEAFQVMWEDFNSRCQPPWSEKELRHKVHDAVTKPFGKPRGWLLSEHPWPPHGTARAAGKAGASCGGSSAPLDQQPVTDPHRHALEFLRDFYTHEGLYTLRRWDSQWWRWDRKAYAAVSEEYLAGQLTESIRAAYLRAWEAETKAWEARLPSRKAAVSSDN
jgi:hypothetical protein